MTRHHRAVGFTVFVSVASLLWPALALAQTDESTEDQTGSEEEVETAPDPVADEAQEELDAELVAGAEVYSRVCSSCHQPGGVGLDGTYPPLVDNPNVDDADYVATVVENGQQGEITVLGESYDGVMPSFSTLGDDEVEAVISYLQADFAAPSGAVEDFASETPVIGTTLPGLASATALGAYLVAILAALIVLWPRLSGVSDRLSMPWLDAWLKTAVIVVGLVFVTVFVPDLVLQSSTVAGMDPLAQELIGTGIFVVGLVGALVALRYLHRESRI